MAAIIYGYEFAITIKYNTARNYYIYIYMAFPNGPTNDAKLILSKNSRWPPYMFIQWAYKVKLKFDITDTV